MYNPSRSLSIGAVGALALLSAGCAENGAAGDQEGVQAEVITFGVVPAETREATLSSYATFMHHFEEETGFEIEIFEATNVAPVIEATIAGDLDLVMLGPFAQSMAREAGADITTVGALIDRPGNEENLSVGLTMEDGGPTTLQELQGEDVCFIDPGSASGYLYPAAALLEEGIDPEDDLNGIFIGDHTSAVESMMSGECAAAFTHGTNLEYVAHREDLRVIYDEVVPSPGISVSTLLEDEVQQIVTDAVLDITGDMALDAGTCAEDRLYEDEGDEYCHAIDVFWGVAPQDDSYWESVREVCEATRAPACEE
ncbi:phosphate/phosphite/phosphonate ABC transporter substrate-binding protein [Nesterenkonia suensis]